MFLLAVSTANAAEPTEPPVLQGLSIAPASVDVTSSSQTVTVTAHITDGSGLYAASVGFLSPSGKQHASGGFTKVSGTETDGTYEATVAIAAHSEPGTWKLTSIRMLGNLKTEASASVNTAELEAKGFPASVQVADTNPYTEPPVLQSLSIEPSSVDVTSSSQTVTVTAHITTNGSGFDAGSVHFLSPSGKYGKYQTSEVAGFRRVLGTETDGTYEATVAIAAHSEPGTWTLSSIAMVDNLGNERNVNTAELEATSFPADVQVADANPYTEEPPVLQGLSIKPASVDVTSSSQTVTVTAHITDGSGLYAASVGFGSPSGKQGASGGFTKVSGTETDGTYEATVAIAAHSEPGTWKLSSIGMLDNLKNEAGAIVHTAELEAKGFPASVQVADANPYTEPPVLQSLSIEPSSVNTNRTCSSHTVAIRAHITTNGSGLNAGTVHLLSPGGEEEGKKVQTSEVAGFRRVSGTATDGIYEVRFEPKGHLEPGTWTLSSIGMVDNLGNETNVNTAELEAKGFPATVQVRESPACPTVVTEPASSVTQTSATLNATVNPNGETVSECYFEYGTTEAYGSTVSCTPPPGSGGSPVPVSASLEMLTLNANTTYHVRVVATNAGGTSYGSDQALKTLPSPPTVMTGAATSITQGSVTLNASVNPNGGTVSDCHFEYGTSEAYGPSVSCTPLPGSGESPVAVSAPLGSLNANTTYHFRVVATNAGGTSYGSDQTFTTLNTSASETSTTPTGSATASNGPLSATTSHGEGTVTVGQYASNPAGTPPFISSGGYIDAYLSPGNTFKSLEFTDCELNGGESLYWWNPQANGGNGEWQAVSDETAPSGSPACITVTINETTQPTLKELTGTVFGVARVAARPKASISSPAAGGVYARGATIATKFSCMEGEYGPGIESCKDSNGGSGTSGTLSTSTVGLHTFTVTAKSKDGQTATATISYTVALVLNAGTTSCNSLYFGSGKEVTVPAGAVCTLLAGTKVSGNVQVQKGGALIDQGAVIGKNVTANNATSIHLGGGSIGGDLKLQNLIGGPNSLTSATVTGNVEVENNGSSSPIAIETMVIRGNLQVHNNAANVTVNTNKVTGNLQVHNNMAKVTVTGNTATGNIEVEKNTVGGGTLTSNSAGKKCQLQKDMPAIMGGPSSGPLSNTAGGTNTCNRSA